MRKSYHLLLLSAFLTLLSTGAMAAASSPDVMTSIVLVASAVRVLGVALLTVFGAVGLSVSDAPLSFASEEVAACFRIEGCDTVVFAASRGTAGEALIDVLNFVEELKPEVGSYGTGLGVAGRLSNTEYGVYASGLVLDAGVVTLDAGDDGAY